MEYLPNDTATIVLKLLEKRKQTFSKSTVRFEEQYFDYDGEGAFQEHPLCFYPNNRLVKYGKKYKVSNSVDQDFCSKNFQTHSDFTSGIFRGDFKKETVGGVQQLEIIILHHSSFILHHSSFFIHPSSFFIHPSFILRLLSFSACFFGVGGCRKNPMFFF